MSERHALEFIERDFFGDFTNHLGFRTVTRSLDFDSTTLALVEKGPVPLAPGSSNASGKNELAAQEWRWQKAWRGRTGDSAPNEETEKIKADARCLVESRYRGKD